ncbi:MAG: metallophosphoesterase protein, partial [Bryobacterales bacterium]|nr:metallophosphoesterase protein [Bryobacterales bacterium]
MRWIFVLLAVPSVWPFGAVGQEAPAIKPIGILLAAGDIAKCSPKPNEAGNQTDTAALIDAEIAKADAARVPIRVLALGDLAYEYGADFSCFNESWGKYRDRMLPVPGNHDYVTKGAATYFKYFETVLKELKAEQDGVYALSFPNPDTGPWRLIAVNTNVELGTKSPQLKWLKTELENSKHMPCVLAFSHAFYYSSGRHGHGQNSKIDLSAQPRALMLLRPLYEMLVAQRASVFLAGHDHHFEQFSRTNAQGAASRDGVRSFVVGTGGYHLYQNDYQNKWSFTEAYTHQHHGILKMELFDTRYQWEFLTTRGEKFPLPINADA